MESLELQIAQCAVESGLLKQEELHDASEIQNLCMEMHLKIPLGHIILEKYLPKIEHRNQYLIYTIEKSEIAQIKEYLDPYMMELGSFWEEAMALSCLDSSGIELAMAKKIERELRDMDLFVSVLYVLLIQSKNKLQNISNIPYMNIERSLDLEYFCHRSRGKNILPLHASIHQLTRSILGLKKVEQALQIQKELEQKKLPIPLLHILIERYSIEAYLLHALLLSQIYCEHNSIQIRWNELCLQKIRMPAGFIPKIKAAQIQCADFLQWSFKLSWLNFTAKKQGEILKVLEKKVSKKKWNESVDISNNLQERKLPLSLLKILALTHVVSQEDLLETVLSVVYNVPDSKMSQAMQSCGQDLEDTEEENQTESPESIEEKEESPEIIKVVPYNKNILNQTMAISSSHLGKKKKTKKTSESVEEEASSTKAVEIKEAEKVIKEEAEKVAKEEKDIKNTRQIFHASEDLQRVRMALQENLLDKEGLVRILWDRSEDLSASIWETIKERSLISPKIHQEISKRPISENMVSSVEKGSNPKDLTLSKILVDYKILTREQLQKLFRVQNILKGLEISISLEELILKTKLVAQEILTPLIENQEKKRQQANALPLKETSRISRDDLSNKLKQTMRLELPGNKKARNPFVLYSAFFVVAGFLLLLLLSLPSPSEQQTKKPQNHFVEKKPDSTLPVIPKNIEEKKPTMIQEENKASIAAEKKAIHTIPEKSVSTVMLENMEIVRQKDSIFLQGKFSVQPPLQEKIKIQCSLWDSRKTNKTGEQTVLCEPVFSFSMTQIPAPLQYGFYYIRIHLDMEEKPNIVAKDREWWIPFVYGTTPEIKKSQEAAFQAIEKRSKKIYEMQQELVSLSQKPLQEIKKQWKPFSERWNKKYRQAELEMQKQQANSWTFWDVYWPKEMLSFLDLVRKDYESLQDWVQGFSLLPVTLKQKDFWEKWQQEIRKEKEYQASLLMFSGK
ncbi:MAG: hypothetical protein HUU50_12625 [Candidatus Brocadiae bacterium]|nr:hypothetical protein [Candidatus Brocadiia bacterium]